MMDKAIRVRTTASGDEWISPGSIFIIRRPDAYFREAKPHYMSFLKSSNYEGHSIDDMETIIPGSQKDSFVILTAPSGQDVWVNGKSEPDRDEPNPVLDHKMTKSVLRFGPGADAPRQAIREGKDELVQLWTEKGWDSVRMQKPLKET